MKLIIYTGPIKELGNDLGKMIQAQLPKIQIKTLTSASDLSRTLCRPMNRISVIIIYASCGKDLRGLLPLEPLFDNIRLILILPRMATGMVALGLQLNPSFISYLDSDFSDVISVLNKIYPRTREAWQWQAGIERPKKAENLKFKDE